VDSISLTCCIACSREVTAEEAWVILGGMTQPVAFVVAIGLAERGESSMTTHEGGKLFGWWSSFLTEINVTLLRAQGASAAFFGSRKGSIVEEVVA